MIFVKFDIGSRWEKVTKLRIESLVLTERSFKISTTYLML